jgi:hypothetical protein
VPGTLQEGGASFQTTHWTLLLRAAQNEPTGSVRQALSAFCEAYWPPLYAFLRHRRYSSTDAQDLVQAFFAHLLAQNTLSHGFFSPLFSCFSARYRIGLAFDKTTVREQRYEEPTRRLWESCLLLFTIPFLDLSHGWQ